MKPNRLKTLMVQNYLLEHGYELGEEFGYIEDDELIAWLKCRLEAVNNEINDWQDPKLVFDYGYNLGVAYGMLEVDNAK